MFINSRWALPIEVSIFYILNVSDQEEYIGIEDQENYLFATVPDSSINSWESWFIFNLQKINTNQYYESDSLDVGNCSMLRGYITLLDVKHKSITVHT
jgi:hypothetical protein